LHQWLAEWAAPGKNAALALPEPNAYIATDFALVYTHEHKVRNATMMLRLWLPCENLTRGALVFVHHCQARDKVERAKQRAASSVDAHSHKGLKNEEGKGAGAGMPGALSCA
jgi:hypothetical protein